MTLPLPTAELVQVQCNAFDEENHLGESALSQLWERFPQNTEPSQVLLKVIALNHLYRTRIRDIDIEPLSRHMSVQGLDESIGQGSPTAVEQIFVCEGLHMYYSFATKFCSWHNPAAYPIYDHYVDECLWAYKKQHDFFDFKRQDVYLYEKFVEIVSAFRDHYSLNAFSFKQLDKFLWCTGEQLLRERGVAAEEAPREE